MTSFCQSGERLVYSHVDRIIVGGACPVGKTLKLGASRELGADYFLERRELGIINIGGAGQVILDGEVYELAPRDGLYVGMGIKDVEFKSVDPKNPAKLYMNSAPAHKSYPTVKIDINKANKRKLGTPEESNVRTINQFIKMLTRNIASEYGEYNIQCNGIGPGYIATPQTAPLRERQPDGSRHPFDSFIIAKTPAARWGTPEDLAGPAVFLASDASNFVNGHVLYVDGGILAYIGKQP